jgi:hypothetical protein
MLLPRDEIIAEIDGRIKSTGADYSDWCVGVAKDSQEPHFEAHLIEDRNDGFLYRQAFTLGCAQEIRGYFVTQRGATVDHSSSNGGRLVYVYRKTSRAPSACAWKSDHPFVRG